MSQAGAFGQTGGGGGAVDSVTGIYPIIASPTTGNVVVSGNVVFNTPIVTGIDFTMIQTIPLFTTVNDFVVQGLYILFDTVVSANGDAVLSFGYNSPTFDNVDSNTSAFTSSASNGTFNFVIGFLPAAGLIPIVPAGQTITLNITTGDSGTTVMGRAFLIGSYL